MFVLSVDDDVWVLDGLVGLVGWFVLGLLGWVFYLVGFVALFGRWFGFGFGFWCCYVLDLGFVLLVCLVGWVG